MTTETEALRAHDNVQRLSGISDGASYCADAIRAGAKEPSDADQA